MVGSLPSTQGSSQELLHGLKDTKLWAHLRTLLVQFLTEQPHAPMDVYDAFNHFLLHGTMTPASVSLTQQRMLTPASSKTSTSDLLERHRTTKALEAAIKSTLWAKGYLDLVTPKTKKKKASDEEDEEVENDLSEKVELEDIVHTQELFRAIGEGVSAVESQHLAVALRHLGNTQPLSKVRFWGRILATKRDYYIAETTWSEDRAEEMNMANVEGNAPDEGEGDGDGADSSGSGGKTMKAILDVLNRYHIRKPTQIPIEGPKVGANTFRYYVMCSDRWMEWALLPNVEPAWIHAARMIHTLFTGDLDASIRAHPPFPGREREYLRAQIARISHATHVAPKGVLQCEDPVEEETGDENESEAKQGSSSILESVKLIQPYAEIPVLTPTVAPAEDDEEAITLVRDWYYGYPDDVLMELSKWVHINSKLLQGQARATLFVPDAGEDTNSDDEDEKSSVEWTALRATREERVPRLLTPVHFDANSSTPSTTQQLPKDYPWCIRKAYHTLSNPSQTYGVKSLLWPGAVCVARVTEQVPGAEFQNVYIGYGLKARDGTLYTPTPPFPFMHEFPCPHDVLQMDATREEEEAYAVEPEVAKDVTPEGDGNEGDDE